MSTVKRAFFARAWAAWSFRASAIRGRQAVPGAGAITDQGGRIHILGGGPGRVFTGG